MKILALPALTEAVNASDVLPLVNISESVLANKTTGTTVSQLLTFLLANIPTHDTVADLRAAAVPTYSLAFVLGGAAKLDGDGGIYYFDTASVAAESGNFIVKPSALPDVTPGRWYRWING